MPSPSVDLTKVDALILVDVQRDFCPGGRLPIPKGDEVVPVLNRWLDAARAARIPIVASRDWHPSNHVSFEARGGRWPVHCVQGSEGAAFHEGLAISDDVLVVSKGQLEDRDAYSAFDGTGLADRLRSMGVERLWVGGLAEDVCVRATVLDGLKAGFEVRLIDGGMKPVTEQGGRDARAEMRSAGATVATLD